MKALIAAVLLSFATAGLAQSGHGSHQKMDEAPATKAQQSHSAKGVIKAVSTEKGSVTVAHEPVGSLGWPAMTMGFKPRDKKLLQTLKPGQSIEFEFVQQGKDYVITRVK